jgi:phosphate uptake regulator
MWPVEARKWRGTGNTLLLLPEIHLELMFKKGGIMLQASEIQKRFTHLQQTISDASRTCHADKTIPADLMNRMDELDKECKSAKKVMASKDEDRIRQCVEDLERIGDRAERACQQAGSLDARIKDAVSLMHSELTDLKRQFH